LISFNRSRLLNLRQLTRDIITALLVLAVTSLAVQLGRWHFDLPRWIIAGIALGMLGGAIDVALWLTRIVYSDFAHFRWVSQGFFYAPDAVMASNLINAIVQVRRKPGQWSNLRFRRSILYDLEMCARCIDYYIPRALTPYDHDTWTWELAETRRIAGAIRKLKNLIILPTQDSQELFLERTTEALYSMAVGDWSSLDQVEMGEVAAAKPRPSLRRRLITLLGAITRAVVPLALALAATQIGFGASDEPLITGEIANYLLGGTAIYTAIVLVMAIDPELTARVTTAREILGMIPTQDRQRGEVKGTGFDQ
jgi:hypothetical protein